jgi:hypothetical protein
MCLQTGAKTMELSFIIQPGITPKTHTHSFKTGKVHISLQEGWSPGLIGMIIERFERTRFPSLRFPALSIFWINWGIPANIHTNFSKFGIGLAFHTVINYYENSVSSKTPTNYKISTTQHFQLPCVPHFITPAKKTVIYLVFLHINCRV